MTAVAEGETWINARVYNAVDYIDLQCKVKVVRGTVTPINVEMNKSNMTLNKGNTAYLFATVYPTDATDKSVTWSSSNTSVATVSSSGKVTAVAAGTATITATSNANTALKDTCKVTVKSGTVSFSWTTGSTKYGTIESKVANVTGTSAYFPYYCATTNVAEDRITEVGVVYTNLRTEVRKVVPESVSFSGKYNYFYAQDGYYVKNLTPGMQYSYYYYAVYEGVTYTSAAKTFYTTGSTTGTLKVTGYLDGVSQTSLGSYGTFDVYVNGTRKANDVTSYNVTLNVGDTYQITDIRSAGLHKYSGLRSGSLSGTIASGATSNPVLTFVSNPTYRVTIDPDGGQICGQTPGAVCTFNVTEGDTKGSSLSAIYASEYGSYLTLSREGYVFDGLYTQDGTTRVYDADGKCVNEGTYWSGNVWCGKSNVTLKAQWIDNEAPKITSVVIADQDLLGYTVVCTVSDNVGVTKVDVSVLTDRELFPQVASATQSGDTWTYRVLTSDHVNGASGLYYTTVEAFDAQGNTARQSPETVSYNSGSGLENVLYLPEALKVIEEAAFVNTGAEIIVIPAGVTSVAADAFDGCESLKYIINHSSVAITAPEGVTVIDSVD